MRGSRAYWIVAGYVAFLSLIMMLFYASWWRTTMASGSGFSTSSKVGAEFFNWCILIQVFLVAFITPALTSGSLTIEKEQQTLDFMMLTKLTPFQIVTGKLLTAMGFTGLILTATLPVISVCFFLGGVSPQQIVSSYLGLLAASLVSASMGIAWSAVANSTAMASIMTYLSLAAPFIAMLIFLWSMAPLSDLPDFNIAWGLICGLVGVKDPLDSWNPALPLFSWWDRSHFLIWELPRVLLPGLIILSITGLLLIIAGARISPRWKLKQHLLRQAALSVLVIVTVTFLGWRFSFLAPQAPAFAGAFFRNSTALSALFLPIFLLQLMAPVMCTGEMELKRVGLLPWLMSGFRRSAYREAKLESGFAFVFKSAMLICAIYAISMAIVGMSSSIVSGIDPRQAVGKPGVAPVMTPGNFSATRDVPNALWHLLAVLAAWSLFAATIGRLFSTIARSRYSAAAVHYVWTLFVFLGPAISLTTSNAQQGIIDSPIEWLALLNPSYVLLNTAQNIAGTKMQLDQLLLCQPYWLWSIVAMLFATVGCEWLTGIAQRHLVPRRNNDSDSSIEVATQSVGEGSPI